MVFAENLEGAFKSWEGPCSTEKSAQTCFCELFGVTERCGTWRGTFAYESKGPPPLFWRKGPVQKMLLDGRVKLNPDALDLAPVPDVDLLDHSLEEHILRFGRANWRVIAGTA